MTRSGVKKTSLQQYGQVADGIRFKADRSRTAYAQEEINAL